VGVAKAMFQSMIVGLGQIGLMYDFDVKRYKPSSHTLAYENHPEINLIAASDLYSERKPKLLELAPKTTYYKDYKLMLAEQTADVISICTPPQSHFEIIQAIITSTSTRLILCEKPIVQNNQEAQQLMDLLSEYSCKLIPNLSRRWSSGFQRIHNVINNNEFGSLVKVHARYTRGIFNTGAHIFDLINWYAGEIKRVLVMNQVNTTADQDEDPSFSFHFTTEQGISGYAEAFNDRNYYMFEMDLFFETGKIEIRESGNKIYYSHVSNHPLFTGFLSLHPSKLEDHLLEESTMQNAINHIVNVLKEQEEPICTVRNGLYPIAIAQAVLRSYTSMAWEDVRLNA
jgi:predicted dehydrogenase